MDEVGTTKGSGDERRSRAGRSLDEDCVADVAEDLIVAEASERKLDPVGVGGELEAKGVSLGRALVSQAGRTSSRV